MFKKLMLAVLVSGCLKSTDQTVINNVSESIPHINITHSCKMWAGGAFYGVECSFSNDSYSQMESCVDVIVSSDSQVEKQKVCSGIILHSEHSTSKYYFRGDSYISLKHKCGDQLQNCTVTTNLVCQNMNCN